MAEAGSSIPLSVLLEYQGCRRRLSVSTVDGIPDAISDCLRRLLQGDCEVGSD